MSINDPQGTQAPAPVTILIVEDEPMIRFLIAETLRDLNALVVEASSGDEAWNYLCSRAPVDLVFTDHRMPGLLNGAALASRIREHFPALEVVITSAHFDDPAWRTPILSKPYRFIETAHNLLRLASRAQGKDKP